MANKNTNMILAVAVIAVCAIAIIGVGYAYTATTENTGNDSSVKYITLTQGDTTAKYANAFDKEITYDTKRAVVNDTVTTTYTLTPGQAETSFAVSGVTAVKLGVVEINTSKVNTKDGFKFSVTNEGTMNGTFYIGIKVGDSEIIRAYTPGSPNYYQTTSDDHSTVTEDTNASIISPGSATVDKITVSMYLGVPPSTAPTSPNDKPLNDVKFIFTATAPATS